MKTARKPLKLFLGENISWFHLASGHNEIWTHHLSRSTIFSCVLEVLRQMVPLSNECLLEWLRKTSSNSNKNPSVELSCFSVCCTVRCGLCLLSLSRKRQESPFLTECSGAFSIGVSLVLLILCSTRWFELLKSFKWDWAAEQYSLVVVFIVHFILVLSFVAYSVTKSRSELAVLLHDHSFSICGLSQLLGNEMIFHLSVRPDK